MEHYEDDPVDTGIAGATEDGQPVPVPSLRYVEAGESPATASSSGSNEGGVRSWR